MAIPLKVSTQMYELVAELAAKYEPSKLLLLRYRQMLDDLSPDDWLDRANLSMLLYSISGDKAGVRKEYQVLKNIMDDGIQQHIFFAHNRIGDFDIMESTVINMLDIYKDKLIDEYLLDALICTAKFDEISVIISRNKEYYLKENTMKSYIQVDDFLASHDAYLFYNNAFKDIYRLVNNSGIAVRNINQIVDAENDVLNVYFNIPNASSDEFIDINLKSIDIISERLFGCDADIVFNFIRDRNLLQ